MNGYQSRKVVDLSVKLVSWKVNDMSPEIRPTFLEGFCSMKYSRRQSLPRFSSGLFLSSAGLLSGHTL